MSRPRSCFARPFVLTVAVALPACGGPGARVTRTDNPPARPSMSWNVKATADGGCLAFAAQAPACPPVPGETCNPPPPQPVACPDGITPDTSVSVVRWEADGECYAQMADGSQPTACPR